MQIKLAALGELDTTQLTQTPFSGDVNDRTAGGLQRYFIYEAHDSIILFTMLRHSFILSNMLG